MLEALPAREREFYSSEDHVVDPVGKSSAIFKELEDQYSFVGALTTNIAPTIAVETSTNLCCISLMEET